MIRLRSCSLLLLHQLHRDLQLISLVIYILIYRSVWKRMVNINTASLTMPIKLKTEPARWLQCFSPHVFISIGQNQQFKGPENTISDFYIFFTWTLTLSAKVRTFWRFHAGKFLHLSFCFRSPHWFEKHQPGANTHLMKVGGLFGHLVIKSVLMKQINCKTLFFPELIDSL